jgi:hypothetical protein
VVANSLLDDLVGVSLQHIRLCLLDRDTAKVAINHDPRDRVSVPLEAGVLLDDAAIHRHENPRRVHRPRDGAYDVWVQD